MSDQDLFIAIGVDPGASGGLAWVTSSGEGLRASAVSMKNMTMMDIWEWFAEVNGKALPRFAVLEKVWGFVGAQQEFAGKGPKMFTFGATFGRLQMALVAGGIPFTEVAAPKWQRAVGVISRKGEAKAVHKRRLKERAQSLFPELKVTLATADALLLAYYCHTNHKWIASRPIKSSNRGETVRVTKKPKSV